MNGTVGNNTDFNPRAIFSLTYADLLRHSGFSHPQFVGLALVIFLILSLLYMLIKLGLTQRVKIKNEQLAKSTFIYRSYEGPNH